MCRELTGRIGDKRSIANRLATQLTAFFPGIRAYLRWFPCMRWAQESSPFETLSRCCCSRCHNQVLPPYATVWTSRSLRKLRVLSGSRCYRTPARYVTENLTSDSHRLLCRFVTTSSAPQP